MSFSSEAKAELCRIRAEKKNIALAECYGIVLYCHTFSANEIRIITANADFAALLPKLFHRAFGVEFDRAPKEGAAGKRSFVISDREKLVRIFNSFGAEIDDTLSNHINLGVLEEDSERVAFVRGAFLAGGSVTDPEKHYHLELATPHRSVSREMHSILLEMNLSPKEATRGGNSLLYFKQADAIADFFAAIGASGVSVNIHAAKVEKEMNNLVTRKINCDNANTDKTVSAAQEQISAIHYIAREYGSLDVLPDQLKEAAILRVTNPEASLADLAQLSIPKVTKSCLAHRLRKIMSFVPEDEK